MGIWNRAGPIAFLLPGIPRTSHNRSWAKSPRLLVVLKEELRFREVMGGEGMMVMKAIWDQKWNP